MRALTKIARFLQDEEGGGLAEYGFIIAGIAAALMIILVQAAVISNARFVELQSRLAAGNPPGSGPPPTAYPFP